MKMALLRLDESPAMHQYVEWCQLYNGKGACKYIVDRTYDVIKEKIYLLIKKDIIVQAMWASHFKV